MQPQRNLSSQATARETTFDAGLRSYFQKIYNTMAVGLVFTGLVAWVVAHSPMLLEVFFGNGVVRMIVMFAPLGFLFFGFTPGRLQRMSAMKLAGLFYAFSGVFGISLATIFLAYSGESIARVFFITSAMFAGMSVYGYTTKRDLSGMRSMLFMGVWGLFIAMLVNMFFHSPLVYFVTSCIGVVVYTGLTMWDTQNLKMMYSAANGHEANNKMAIMGALSLYVDFINLFMFLLRLMGNSRN